MTDEYENLENKAKEIFEDLYYKLEGRIKNLTSQVKKDFLPETEKKLKKNIFKTVILSFGAGFIIGLIVAFSGKARAKKK